MPTDAFALPVPMTTVLPVLKLASLFPVLLFTFTLLAKLVLFACWSDVLLVLFACVELFENAPLFRIAVFWPVDAPPVTWAVLLPALLEMPTCALASPVWTTTVLPVLKFAELLPVLLPTLTVLVA